MGWVLTITRGPSTLKREFEAAVREGLLAVARRWHGQFLPEHFKPSAFIRYGYQQRQGANQQNFLPTTQGKNQTPVATNQKGLRYFRYQTPDGSWHTSHGELGYTAKKMKKYGHAKPLVYTGRLEEAVKSAARFTATNKGVTIRMQSPRWLRGFLGFRGPRGTGPDMYKELTTITRDEAEALQRTLKDTVSKVLAKARENRRVTS